MANAVYSLCRLNTSAATVNKQMREVDGKSMFCNFGYVSKFSHVLVALHDNTHNIAAIVCQ